jgi:hypothetical protein
MATIMKSGILGITEMSVHHGVGEDENWDDIFPGNAIIKCGHCGQFAARKTACKHCGAPVG